MRRGCGSIRIHIDGPRALTYKGFYLASSLEYTETFGLVPKVEGKSSIGRLGLQIHLTAGVGDVGFQNNWTFELKSSCIIQLEVGQKIAQVLFFKPSSIPEEDYSKVGRYNGTGLIESKGV